MAVISERPMRTLSSAVAGGGLVEARAIVNWRVPKGYACLDPAGDLEAYVRGAGLPTPFVGLMTAAHVEKAQCTTLREGELAVCAIVTAGLSNPSSAGLSLPAEGRPGTINVIVLVDARLTDAAMVNAVITGTEAKSHVLLERGARTPDGHRATGTSTDAVVVACTGRGGPLPYAGPATRVGWLIGRAVRDALARALG